MILFYILIDFLVNLCVNLPLQPKNFRSKKIQKSRKLRYFKLNYSLNYGTIGLMLTRPLQFTANTLSKLKIFLKRSMKKSDKTRRQM
jgi:ribosomal protein L16/L10AE